MFRALFLTMLLLGSRSTRAAEPSWLENCALYYAALKPQLQRNMAKYWEEVKASYGSRVFVRAVSPEEAAVESRWLGFWHEMPAGETPWYEYLHNKTRALVDADFVPEPNLGNRFRFSFFAGVDSATNYPIRAVSRRLQRYGVLKEEYQLTAPVLFVAGYFTLGLPVSAIRYVRERRHETKMRDRMVGDYRFNGIVENWRKLQEELDTMEKGGADAKSIREAREKLLRVALNDVGLLEKAYRDYFSNAQKYARRWGAASGQKRAKLESEHLLFLAESPLFSDIPEELGIADAKALLDPKNRARAEALLALRERLYWRYTLIPAIVKGGKDLQALESSPGAGVEVKAILASPLYSELKRMREAGQIDALAFQRSLMEDSFWQLDRFAAWKVLGREVPKLDPDGNSTGQPLRLEDIHEEILEMLKVEHGLAPDLQHILQRK